MCIDYKNLNPQLVVGNRVITNKSKSTMPVFNEKGEVNSDAIKDAFEQLAKYAKFLEGPRKFLICA